MTDPAAPSRLYVFGDQTFDYEDSLTKLLRSNDVHLVSFFHECCAAIQTELGRLPHHARDTTHKFTSVADLVTRKRQGNLSSALEQVLCLIHIFAKFIWQHSSKGLTYPTAQDSQLIGLCTGALAAAAISSSRDLTHLVPAATHAVVIALHTGLRSAEVALSISGRVQSTQDRWSMVVPASQQAISSSASSSDTFSVRLESFNSRRAKLSSFNAYISASSANSLTISGPPHVLTSLTQDDVFAKQSSTTLPVRSPYHAPHLFSHDDVELILGKACSWASEASVMAIPLVSCGIGHSVWALSSHALLESAVHDILTRQLLMDKAFDFLSSTLKVKANLPSKILIIPVGTDVGGTMQHRLQSELANRTSIAIHTGPLPNHDSEKGQTRQSRIAVVGMSGRFPGASNPEALWELLQNKIDMCREVPELRWDAKTHVDPTGKRKNTSKVRWGCWLEDPDFFDSTFFAISPREAPQVDPAQRIALMTAYEAMEHAGIVPGRTPSTREDRVGVFYGVTSNDWCESNSGQDIDAYYIPGANRAFIPGRINYFFKFSGPSFAIDTACSSSLAAVHMACNALWQGDIDTAIAGGTNVLTNPDMTTGLDKGHFLSATGNCKTFDESADGYCRGEGVATVILKRLEDAIEDEDPIYGVIGSAYTNHSAEAESITRPHVGAQKDIFERVLNDSGTDPFDVTYVEMHGTGTQAGDTREMNSVCDVLAPMDDSQRHKRSAEQTLHLGALKSNIGHGESVSGVSALIKVLMMMRKQTIPPHCGIKTRINPSFPSNLAARNVSIDLESTPWLRSQGKARKAIINNFSAAGGNSSILVEESPLTAIKQHGNSSIRPFYPIALSAKCAKSLKANIQSLMDHISSGDVSLPQLSYTTTARRVHHPFRCIVASNSIDGLQSQLVEALDDSVGSRRPPPVKEMLFVFTGQGSQYPGMAKQLLESLSVFREQMTHFDALAQGLGFPAILPIFTASSVLDAADFSPIVTQIANVCMQIVLARLWISWGITPTAVAGHSLGEYAALNIAGVLSDVETIYLIGCRARHMEQMCKIGSHAMLAVQASVAELERLSSTFEIACINAPRETVLAGTVAQIFQWQRNLSEAGIRSTVLQIPYAFHSSQVEPIQKAIATDAQMVNFRKPQIPVLSSLHGRVVEDVGVFNPDYIFRHAREPVQMMKCLQSAFETGVIGDSTYAIEFGPHPIVSSMIKATLGSSITVLPTLHRKSVPWEILTKTLCALYTAGLPIKWDGYFADIPTARKVIELPAYKWDLKSYWISYRNDWTLTKGDIPVENARIAIQAALQPSIPVSQQPCLAVTQSPKLESSTIHRILQDKVVNQGYQIVTECDTTRADVKPFIASHKVDGFSLCTPAVYADIAFTIGNYVLKRFGHLNLGSRVAVANVDITKALIATDEWKQLLRCSATFDWDSKRAKVSFTVHDENGNETSKVSTCQIRFVCASEDELLQHDLLDVKASCDKLRVQSTEGKTCRIDGSMAYRLVATLAEFNPDYHCIDEVLYNDESYEAFCTVSFGQMKKGGSFHVNPGAIDGLTQSAGFAMNANSKTKLDTDVFVNHGWDDFLLLEDIRDDCQYHTHVRMTVGEEALWTGDISIYSGSRMVGLAKGVKIQGVPRRLLKFILTQAAKPPKTKAKAQTTKTVTTPTTTPAAPITISATMTKTSDTLPPTTGLTVPTAHISSKSVSVTVVPVAADSEIIEAPLSDDTSTRAIKAMEIISEQSGVPVSDLRDDVRFDDIGIDSLLSLMITSQFAEELEVEVDSNLFVANGTIADVRKIFVSNPRPSDQKVPVITTKEVQLVHQAAILPPPLPEMPQSAPEDTLIVPLIDPKFSSILQIISEEVEVPLEELVDETSLASLGVDSLLSLMIGSRLRDELDIDIDTNALLSSLDSLRALREALFPIDMAISDTDSASDMNEGHDTPPSEENSGSVTPLSMIDIPCEKAEVPPTTSVILQGNPRTCTKTMFFFPDGSGLASSYVSLPRIQENLLVYGLNSPYLKKGLEMNCTWDEMVDSYLKEVRRRQPHGPYSFAGWSAGGILSFSAARILMSEGEEVRDLIIIDSPVPENLQPLPEHFFQYCKHSGLFGGTGPAPEWLIQHFRNINKVLSTFYASPLTVSTLRKVNILWACESSVDQTFQHQPGEPEDMKFLTEKRTDFTAGRWARLFPGVPIQIDRALGKHHWNLLKDESAIKVAAYIADVLA